MLIIWKGLSVDYNILWDEDSLKDIYYEVLRDENINLPLNYHDDLAKCVYKLFNTSSRDKTTKLNITKLCRNVNLYITGEAEYRTVKTLSTLVTSNQDVSTGITSKTHIYDEFEKYKGSPTKALQKSLNIAHDLYQNLLIIGDTKENVELRKYLNNFLLEPEKYTRVKNQKYGDHKVTLTQIKTFLLDLKLPNKTNTINEFIKKLEG